MRLLCVDACLRGEGVSRTRALLNAFLAEYETIHPTAEVEQVRLLTEPLRPFLGEDVIDRERMIDAGRLDDPMFRWARAFAQADHLAVAAPYWDLSFPAMLKIYVENIFVRNLTFRYTREGEPVGLCRGKRLLYLTTAGSPIGEEDWGFGYLRAAAKMLGVEAFDRVSAEGIDIAGWDREGILQKALEEARLAAHRFL